MRELDTKQEKALERTKNEVEGYGQTGSYKA
jgi:hypothetical protein